MAYVADLHIHSRFSRACSKDLTIPNLAMWARIKGIDVLGTGDCLHPIWLEELRRTLYDRKDGFFEYDPSVNSGNAPLAAFSNAKDMMATVDVTRRHHWTIRFVLTTEVACIYKHNDKLRRLHILLMFPSFESVDKVIAALEDRKINLKYDGRPILGMSVQALCELVWKCDPRIVVIPAHIWTPWFGMFGSNSGYDFMGECFGPYMEKIYAIETGLSSQPQMNWRVSELDTKSIISFSDAHSLPNLGRELTIFGGNPSFDEMVEDLKNQNITATIEFFPEEGKYHYSGHRDCKIVYGPEELRNNGPICPVCGKSLTIGVMQRVEELATRTDTDLQIVTEHGIIRSETFLRRPSFQMLVGLEKIVAEGLGVGKASKKVREMYDILISQLGSELFILTKSSIGDIKAIAGEKIAEGVERVREGKLEIEPGFDNTYGKIQIFADE
jgi:uncharacterized protein (TIGR00375 family)